MAKDIFGDYEYDWYSYDIAWDKGIELYEAFQISKYNTSDKSELECINDFLNNLKTKKQARFTKRNQKKYKQDKDLNDGQ